MYFGPINTTMSLMMSGLTTLRGYRKFDYFKINYMEALENSASATFCFIVSSRWLSVRLDLICASFVYFTAIMAFVLKDTLSKELLVMSL
jgi:hypothetical protein